MRATLELLYLIAAITTVAGLAVAFIDKMKHGFVSGIAIAGGLFPWITFWGLKSGRLLTLIGTLTPVPLFFFATGVCLLCNRVSCPRPVLATLLGGVLSATLFSLATLDLLGQIG